MQPITAAQRRLLTASPLHVEDWGARVLNLDLTPNQTYGDISQYVRGGTIGHNAAAPVHGSCTLELSTELELPLGQVLIKPHMVLADRSTTARVSPGVFYLSRPLKPVDGAASQTLMGGDRLALLQREVGEDYQLEAGTTYRDALVQVFADAGVTGYLIDGVAGDLVLPVDRPWPLVASSTDPDQTSTPVTWLRIVNDLHAAINFRGVWTDENGLYRCHRYQPPAQRGSEFTFDRDDPRVSIVGVRTFQAPQEEIPNRWVVIASNPPDGVTPSTENGYIVVLENEDEGPYSYEARGDMWWPKVFTYEAADTTVLAELAQRRKTLDLSRSTLVTVETGEFPVAGHYDLFTWVDEEAGGTFTVQALQYEYSLTGGNVRWTWEVIA